MNNYMFSLQRRITSRPLLTVSCVGKQGHHIFLVVSANPGNQALCLNLANCGSFGEDTQRSTGRETIPAISRVPQLLASRNLQPKFRSERSFCSHENQRGGWRKYR